MILQKLFWAFTLSHKHYIVFWNEWRLVEWRLVIYCSLKCQHARPPHTYGTVAPGLLMRRVLALCVFLSLVRSQHLVNTVSQEEAILNQEAILKVEAIIKQDAILKQNTILKQEAIKKETSWLTRLLSHANHKSSSSGDNHGHQQLLQQLSRFD